MDQKRIAFGFKGTSGRRRLAVPLASSPISSVSSVESTDATEEPATPTESDSASFLAEAEQNNEASQLKEPLSPYDPNQVGLQLRGKNTSTHIGGPSKYKSALEQSASAEVFGGDSARLQHDIGKRPSDVSLETYERMPVEAFGLAMLRGMGLKEDGGVKTVQAQPRPRNLGLGADPSTAISLESSPGSNDSNQMMVEEKLLFISSGIHAGLQASLVSRDQDGFLVKLHCSGQLVRVADDLVEFVNKRFDSIPYDQNVLMRICSGCKVRFVDRFYQAGLFYWKTASVRFVEHRNEPIVHLVFDDDASLIKCQLNQIRVLPPRSVGQHVMVLSTNVDSYDLLGQIGSVMIIENDHCVVQFSDQVTSIPIDQLCLYS